MELVWTELGALLDFSFFKYIKRFIKNTRLQMQIYQ